MSYQADPGAARARAAATMRAWRAADRTRARTRNREWLAADPARKRRAYLKEREWADANRERVNARARMNYARRVSQKTWEALKNLTKKGRSK